MDTNAEKDCSDTPPVPEGGTEGVEGAFEGEFVPKESLQDALFSKEQ